MRKRSTSLISFILITGMLLSLCGCSFVPISMEPAVSSDVSDAAVTPAVEAPEMPEVTLDVCISEIMASNKAALADENGDFPDWLELYNYGNDVAVLDGCVLSCGGDSCTISAMSIMPGEYVVLFCGNESGADFSISSHGETVTLTSSRGSFIDEMTIGTSESDESYCKDLQGNITQSFLFTPGFENSADGYIQFQSSLECSSPLQISEVMTYNNSIRKDGEFYDMVELKNVSSSDIQLNDYYLSDNGKERSEYKLPDITLPAGKTYTVYCTGDDSISFEGAAPFALSADYDNLYLSSSDGTLVDYVSLGDIPYGGTKGRIDGENGFFLFTSPYFNSSAKIGTRCAAPMPVSLEKDGVFEGVSSVSVSLDATGTIYYTTDGSVPTASSKKYTEPFSVTETSVIRAVNVVDGCLNSDVLSLSYIINEGHDLPVVSLVTAPDDFRTVYRNPSYDNERQCNVTLYDGDNGFSIDCGFKLHGATSKMAQSKKSMKLTFRSRYSGELNYDLFENGVTSFSSVILRAAQEDTYSTLMRDNLMHQLAIQSCDSLPTQDYKYAVLYVNGEYWGLYNIREAHSPEHFANHFGYDADTVTQYQEAWPSTTIWAHGFNVVTNYDMTKEENYAEVSAMFNLDSIIQWTIVQAYSDNMDCNSPNMRFYYSTDDNQLYFALVDLDLGMFTTSKRFDIPFYTGYAYNKLARELTKNPEYRQRLVETTSELLNGAFSDDNALATLNGLADQIRSEINRDRERWGGTYENWERMYEHLQEFIDGRAYEVAQSLKSFLRMDSEEFDAYFGDIEK